MHGNKIVASDKLDVLLRDWELGIRDEEYPYWVAIPSGRRSPTATPFINSLLPHQPVKNSN
ncbi:hypothetical protein [Merismopedia glauca]|uniref:Uncharacterized protein n=1 Tax=Merismopedia glauca CCAP 1448/3 TaxID=1296344 RepID=A0A2T1BZ46_9CYAN|nr:hypothetical protein [Merismopedia glauca]PSB01306.1 hypothetical protein C7B64_18950 [Merismopedia glauca CCAP 1448/3]